ncbi:MAG: hypothetical protein IT449_06315 [Phycisphaerales bacterium]|nr:hypothetical protein [Phycisphaerales bacterium]
MANAAVERIAAAETAWCVAEQQQEHSEKDRTNSMNRMVMFRAFGRGNASILFILQILSPKTEQA